MLSYLEINPTDSATHSIIWLHGLGAAGSDFIPIASELNLPNSLNMRFIFPDAPVMPVTVNNYYEMRAWYDIYDIAIDQEIDSTGIQQSILQVQTLIANEMDRGVTSEHIFLAGFSQGAVIALLTALSSSKPLGGVIALSGYLPHLEQLPRSTYKMPIFLAHGTEDPIVPYALGLAARTELEQRGYSVDFHHYPMQHFVCEEEIRDIREWVVRVSTS